MKNPIHPAFVMVLFWSMILLIYFVGPVSLTPGISLTGAVFLLSHVTLFMCGSGVAFLLLKRSQETVHRSIDHRREHPLIFWLLLIGIAGGLITIYNSLLAVNGIHLAAIAKLRALKAQHILLEGGEVHGGMLSAIAFLTYPAGFVGLVAAMLAYESMSRVTRMFLYLFIISIFCVAILAGGRSPVMVLLLLVGISSYTRTRLGKPWMPNSRILRLSAGVLLLAFMVYSTVIWSVRAAESSRTPEQALHYAAEIGGATPKPYLVAVSTWLNNPGFTLSTLNSFFYLTQTIQVTEKIVASHQTIPAMYGAYHIDVIAAALRLFPQGPTLLKRTNAILANAGIYGYFAGSWGGLFLDFGYFSLLAAVAWGFFAGATWVAFKNNPGVLTGLFYVFWNYSILIGFASPPFGFSNSFVMFGWFLVFYCGTDKQRS